MSIIATPENGKPLVARTDADGHIHLLYNAADGLKYASSRDGGKTFAASIAVVDRASRKDGLVFEGWDMAIGKGNRVHVAVGTNAWKLKIPKDEWGFHYASLSPGEKAFTPLRNINRRPSEGFSLAADGDGNVAACWLAGKLYVNLSRDGGKTFSPQAEIDPTFDPCNCCTTSSLFDAQGKLAVLYREETNNERDMFLILWDVKANRSIRTRIGSTLWKIEGCPMTYYALTRTESGFLAVWPTKGPIYFARLDAKGNTLPPAEIKTPGKTGMRTGMIGLSGSDGSALIVWRQDDAVKWQLYDAANQPTGALGFAKSPGSGIAAVADKSGRFIVFQ